MTSAGELLARLTTHGPSLDSVGRSTDPDKLTVADIGYALGMGLTREQARLLLAKYCDDKSEARMLKAEFFDWVMGRAVDWHRPKPGMIYGLSYAVCNEFLGTNRCPACQGVAQRIIASRLASCAKCEGTGYVYPSEQDYATAIGCTIQAYRSVWAARVAMCRKELARLEYAALQKFSEILGDE